jgi:uncharacterized protein (DUF3820 family)
MKLSVKITAMKEIDFDENFSEEHFRALLDTKMPFGKYKGFAIADLPEPYLVWFVGKGLPENELGQLLGLMYEIRSNGLEYLLNPLRSPS